METLFSLFFNSDLGLIATVFVIVFLSLAATQQPDAIAIPVRSNEK